MPRSLTKKCRHCQLTKPVETDFVNRRRQFCISCEASRAEGTRAQTLPQKMRKKTELEGELTRLKGLKRSATRPETIKKHANAIKKVYQKLYQVKLKIKSHRERAPKKKVKKQAKTDPVARELADREMSRRRLIHFIKRFNRKYQAGWVHEMICERLEKFTLDVAEKKAPRLMIFMPPRHGKSEIASINYPAWMLGHHPEWEIIASSYAVSLPLGFSRKVRARVKDKTYRSIFPGTYLDRDSTSAENWLTTAGGGYVAAGVGGGITGKGAHVFIIDDPVKDAEEADSETIRDKAWDWYSSTARTRLSPGGGMLVIQTRWHDDDLSGRLLMQMKEQNEELTELISAAQTRLLEEKDPEICRQYSNELVNLRQEKHEIDQWEIITFPALAERDEVLSSDHQILDIEEVEDDEVKEALASLHTAYRGEPIDTEYGWRFLRPKGEALHTARFPAQRLRNIKRGSQKRHWSALYQQNPVPDEGEYFRKDMFRFEPHSPDYRAMKTFIAADLAMSKKDRADWSVFVVGALDYKDQIHVLDMVRVKKDTNDLVDILLTLARKYTPQMVGIEKGQYEIAIQPQLKKRMKEERLYLTMAENEYALKPVQDKELRARPLQGRMQQGMVLFPQNQPWLEQLSYELLRFPGGVHDDIVDALAWLARLVMKHEPPKPPKRKQLKSWKDKLRAHVSGTRSAMEA